MTRESMYGDGPGPRLLGGAYQRCIGLQNRNGTHRRDKPKRHAQKASGRNLRVELFLELVTAIVMRRTPCLARGCDGMTTLNASDDAASHANTAR